MNTSHGLHACLVAPHFTPLQLRCATHRISWKRADASSGSSRRLRMPASATGESCSHNRGDAVCLSSCAY